MAGASRQLLQAIANFEDTIQKASACDKYYKTLSAVSAVKDAIAEEIDIEKVTVDKLAQLGPDATNLIMEFLVMWGPGKTSDQIKVLDYCGLASVAPNFHKIWQTGRNKQVPVSSIRMIEQQDLTQVFIQWVNELAEKSQVGCHRVLFKGRWSLNFMQLQDAVSVPAPKHRGSKLVLADWSATVHFVDTASEIPRLQKMWQNSVQSVLKGTAPLVHTKVLTLYKWTSQGRTKAEVLSLIKKRQGFASIRAWLTSDYASLCACDGVTAEQMGESIQKAMAWPASKTFKDLLGKSIHEFDFWGSRGWRSRCGTWHAMGGLGFDGNDEEANLVNLEGF
eukprot:gnl/MRDRNA2_/MRDRNA2_197293_c0_seq1.p1 gnl/MRDRNA2_/MRDRNA2_197293_c0~~gnl/MRDRNA2_/MRDRNA2_197293_c0_seq1.p1  ORF type:complete len:347 (-),score=61.78 gnl/MRDRNA2_/MRDRNA2_197293_c0_seq1:161-1165(-)